MAEWRNWQTHQTQNLAKFTLRVGSTPTSATSKSAFTTVDCQRSGSVTADFVAVRFEGYRANSYRITPGKPLMTEGTPLQCAG